mmetsp:Transcript_54952/g.95503  ORF Transcript_54952/g.95503 Transcript_54952/m.95503 type:complete len:118 (+) Transcript_54952:3-356(+)
MAQLGIELVLYAAEPGWDKDHVLRQERYFHPSRAEKYLEVERPPGGLSAEKVMDRIFRQRDSYETQLQKKKIKECAFYDQKFRKSARDASSLFSATSAPEDGQSLRGSERRRTWTVH